MIYAETEIQLKNGCTAVVRNARPEDAKQTIEYLRTVSGESPFLLRGLRTRKRYFNFQ